ncbi:GNAT family N-acetyltransferase [Youngiibacter multivorans]|uniref:Ribosomal protein S18 acetylase RimI-like enzyme n=1 Tax=Youngiibacter multivorans TaxID=937251 RepID=A0ABS4G570_9CLOT|nr:GNAT family N-acetyltransferase [Youngiibacter multivorans]MBP1919707.1 ribosomal protein S18 acetylase RimI-like enzyme [Youngiibacter multivorans]
MIRKMEEADYDDAFRLWSGTNGMGLRSLDDSREGIGRFLTKNPDTCFVSEDHEKLTGTILCGHDGRRGYIYHLAVEDEHRGEGIGRALVEAAENALIKEGINKSALVVFRANISGNRFWERMGYLEREDLVYRNRSLKEDNE